MSTVAPYLFFNGNCREALSFYQKVINADLTLMTYGDAQGEGCPLGAKDRIIHGALSQGSFALFASDTPDEPPHYGNSIQLYLKCDGLPQIESYFKALSEGGEVQLPLHDAFWGARFGMLTDRFGINWMLAYEFNKK